MEFEIQFTDITLNESNGDYDFVKDIMNREEVLVRDWIIRSDCMIIMPFGICKLVCNFYYDGRIYIVDHSSSSKEIYNEDVRCLKYWAINSGWKSPEPSPGMIRSWPEYWKHLWDTHVIDSETLDKRYGKRIDTEVIDDYSNSEDKNKEDED